jgi:hypothetical protein
MNFAKILTLSLLLLTLSCAKPVIPRINSINPDATQLNKDVTISGKNFIKTEDGSKGSTLLINEKEISPQELSIRVISEEEIKFRILQPPKGNKNLEEVGYDVFKIRVQNPNGELSNIGELKFVSSYILLPPR